jgi:hypothetical protein
MAALGLGNGSNQCASQATSIINQMKESIFGTKCKDPYAPKSVRGVGYTFSMKVHPTPIPPRQGHIMEKVEFYQGNYD